MAMSILNVNTSMEVIVEDFVLHFDTERHPKEWFTFWTVKPKGMQLPCMLSLLLPCYT